jgi:uncharacterized protein YjbJ (UPF0337 family)
MNPSTTDEIKGTVHEVKGKVKETAGKVTNNPNLEAEGNAEKNTGKVEKSQSRAEKTGSECCQRSLSLKVKCHSSADLPTCAFRSAVPHAGPLSHNALTGHLGFDSFVSSAGARKWQRQLLSSSVDSDPTRLPPFKVLWQETITPTNSSSISPRNI